MAEQHVPAWKRLGLTLKHANDTAPAPATIPTTNTKRSRDEHDTPKGSKKQRLDHNGSNSASAAVPSPLPSKLRSSPEKSSLHTPNSKQNAKSKSVAFTNDTKTEDGESAQNLFQAWANDELEYYAQKAAAYDASEAAKAAQASEEPADQEKRESKTVEKQSKKGAEKVEKELRKEAEQIEKELNKEAKAEKKRAKEAKKKQKSKPNGDEQTTTKQDDTTANNTDTPTEKKIKVRQPRAEPKSLPEYVNYLDQYHTSRSTWKFNKSKQNDLLKNIFNIYRVPSDYNEALAEYLAGLQGAGAKQRLRQSCQSASIDIVKFIRAEIPEVKDEKMDDPEAWKAAFRTAFERDQEKKLANGVPVAPERTKVLREKQEEGERISTISRSVAGGAPAPVAKPVVNDTARLRKKKRKSRTDVSDSDSSSSDDSSDDEDDKKPPTKKIKKAKYIKSDTSSSDSDSSSSSSSSESDSESESSSDDSSSSSSDSDSSDSDSD